MQKTAWPNAAPSVPERMRRVTARLAPTLLLAGLLLACGSDGTTAPAGGDVSLTTTARSYRAGDLVEVSLQNNSTEELQSGACLAPLELRVGTVWSPVPGQDFACPAVLLGHPPGSNRRFVFPLRRELPPGRYRLQFQSLRRGDERALPASATRTNDFEVSGRTPTLQQ